MITMFTIPKPFRGHIGVIQTNAIRSWTLLRPECQIILFGNDEGTSEVASKLGVQHIPGVECNEYGTPLVSSLFAIAQDIAKYETMCFINADIIMMSDFSTALSRVPVDRFLLSGRRWDLDVTEPLDFDNPNWESDLRSLISKQGRLHSPQGVDFYAFPRGLYDGMPPFAVGRTSYDNWFIYRARALGVPFIDATQLVTYVHQNHERTYASVGLEGPRGEKDLRGGLEAERNVQLTGGLDHIFTLEYATHFLTAQGLKPAVTPRHVYLRMRALPVLHTRYRFLLLPFKGLEFGGKASRKLARMAVKR